MYAHGHEGDMTSATMGGMAGAFQKAPLLTHVAGVVREAQPDIFKVVNGQGVQGFRPGHPIRNQGYGLDEEGGSGPQGKQLAPKSLWACAVHQRCLIGTAAGRVR